LPLIEAISCGTPTICSSHPAQLEFATDVSCQVRTKEQRPMKPFMFAPDGSGLWDEPDFEHLKEVMRDVYNDYNKYKKKAIKNATIVSNKFTWENAAEKAVTILEQIDKNMNNIPTLKKEKKAYVLSTDEKYLPYAKLCVESLLMFDNTDVIVYVINADKELDWGWLTHRIDIRPIKTDFSWNVDGLQNPGHYYARIISAIDCLKRDTHQSYMFVDADMIAGKDVSYLWEYKSMLQDYPLCIQYNSPNWYQWREVDGIKYNASYGKETSEILNEGIRKSNSHIAATGFFLFDIESMEFLSEVLDVYNTQRQGITWNVKDSHGKNIFVDDNALSEERVLNYLMWKYKRKAVMPVTWNFPKESPIKDRFNDKQLLALDMGNFSVMYDMSNNKFYGAHPEPGEGKNVEYSKDLWKKFNPNRRKNLMIVAHLDDETIFGAGTLLKNPKDWHIECMTGADDKPRMNEFYSALETLGMESTGVSNYTDSLEYPFPEDAKYHIEHLLAVNDYEMVVTHGEEGEYGHVQHVSLHNIVKDCNPKGLHFFALGTEPLDAEVYKKKQEALAHYKSQVTDLPGFHKYLRYETIVPAGTQSKKKKFEKSDFLKDFKPKEAEITPFKQITINHNFINGPFVEILGDDPALFSIEMKNNDVLIHSTQIHSNHWTVANIKHYQDWNIEISKDGKIIETLLFDAKNKNVFIHFDSAALGDTIAWLPYVEEFAEKHGCKMYCSTFHNKLFAAEYPNITWVVPGATVQNLYASYEIGYFADISKHPNNPKTIPLQQIATDLLGLEYQEKRPRITILKNNKLTSSPHVCIGVQSTAQAKYWNYSGGWDLVVDHLNSVGYKVYDIDLHKEFGRYPQHMNVIPQNAIDVTGSYTLLERAAQLSHAKFFVGLGSGLSWLAWAVGTPVILISGFSAPFTEFQKGVTRVHEDNGCHSCFSNPKYTLDKDNWEWCPENLDFECSKRITPERIIRTVDYERLDRTHLEDGGDFWLREEQLEYASYNKWYTPKDGDVVVDIGASIGIYPALNLQGIDLKACYYIEPLSYNLESLRKNIQEFFPDNKKHIIEASAISTENGEEMIAGDSTWSPELMRYKDNDAVPGEMVKTITFSHFINKYQIERIDMLKTDCEGGEYALFLDDKNMEILQKTTRNMTGELHKHIEPYSGAFIAMLLQLDKYGFEYDVLSIDGFPIKENLLNNVFLEDKQLHAMDFYRQVIFFAKNKTLA
jgi:autotransporter strand-loop-strand O-heptosyltransferase